MQNRYAGDVGDFLKLGLLRALCEHEADSLRLGVNWYLTSDESHNSDGKHIGYLREGNCHGEALERCDPDLFARLRALVRAGNRSVMELEQNGALPSETVCFAEPLTWPHRCQERGGWHQRALLSLATVDLIFADPDNGIRDLSAGSKIHKYALLDELQDYSKRGQSLVVYHHADRSVGGAREQMWRRLDQLQQATGIEPLGGVIGHRGSCRFFLVVPSQAHRELLRNRLISYDQSWRPHAEFVSMQDRSPV